MEENDVDDSSNEMDLGSEKSNDENTLYPNLDVCSAKNNESFLYPKLTANDLKRQPLRSRKFTKENKFDHQFNSEEKKKDHNQDEPTNYLDGSSKEESSDKYAFIRYCVYIGVVIVIFIALFTVYSFINNLFKPMPLSSSEQLNVNELIANLKSTFVSQPPLTYRVIEKAVNNILVDDPISPGIIVLISSSEANETTEMLAKELVTLISKPQDYVLIESKSHLKAEKLKKEIDDTIKSNLEERQLKAVLVKNLDRIPFQAAMMFHSYCDNENAPFKKVVYVMTTFPNESIPPNSNAKDWDTLASKHLRSVWSDSGEDEIAPLLSRLTVSVAAIIAKQ